MKLRALADKRQRLIAEKRIQDILFDAEMRALGSPNYTPSTSQSPQYQPAPPKSP